MLPEAGADAMRDDATERDLAAVQLARERLPAVEWPTLVLLAVAYGGWLFITHAYGRCTSLRPWPSC
jgi:hypothetical protein